MISCVCRLAAEKRTALKHYEQTQVVFIAYYDTHLKITVDLCRILLDMQSEFADTAAFTDVKRSLSVSNFLKHNNLSELCNGFPVPPSFPPPPPQHTHILIHSPN